MPQFNTKEILVLSDESAEVRQFLKRLQAARRILVKDGDEQFVVEYQRLTMTDAARQILTERDDFET